MTEPDNDTNSNTGDASGHSCPWAALVSEANALAKATGVCATEGNMQGAMKIALDIEPLWFEANHILQAATNLWRCGKPG